TNLVETLSGVCEMIEKIARTRGVVVRIALSENLPAVAADRIVVRQIFLALLDDLIETKRCRRIEISDGHDIGYAVLTIAAERDDAWVADSASRSASVLETYLPPGAHQTAESEGTAVIALIGRLVKMAGGMLDVAGADECTLAFRIALPSVQQQTVLIVD